MTPTITRDPGNTHGCGDQATVVRDGDVWRVVEVWNCTNHPWQSGGPVDGDWIEVGNTITDEQFETMADWDE